MTNDSLTDYSQEFNNDVHAKAQAMEMLLEHSFVEHFGEVLCDYGEFDSFETCHWQDRGIKVDGYSFDDEHENLTLIVSHFLDCRTPARNRVTNSEIDKAFKRGVAFFEKSREGKLTNKIDVSNPAHDLASLIHECRKEILSVRIIVITDGMARERRAEEGESDGIAISRVVWDIQRAASFEKTGKREQIKIDFAADYDSPIRCVEMDSACKAYHAFLAFVPGQVLADLYGKWKIRLLERNVRVFLSQRPKVNQGIRDTIREAPTLFCAYNNGITVYATDVELIQLPCGNRAIARVNDFQIVNGGQTTASLYHTQDKFKSDLSDIMVQMKLFVINDDAEPDWHEGEEVLSDVLLPRIGRYSNTQNKVQMADLLANDPPHPELHSISKHCPAPDPTGGSVQSYWFYEKSRGSYEETRRLTAKTNAQKKTFDQKYPKKQRFDKNKFGKAWNSYLKQPHIVCLGAMKNFARFNTWLQNLENEDWLAFFKKTVALVKLWNETERIVRRQKFGGYTHAIVAYSLAWFHEITNSKLDLEKIWSTQTVDESVLDAIELISINVNDHIRNTQQNVSEWCKKEECWNGLKKLEFDGLPSTRSAMLSGRKKSDYKAPDSTEELDRKFCVEKGDAAWWELSKWLKEHDFMQGKQRSQCFIMGRTLSNQKEPSPKLSYACRKIWEQAAASYGWMPSSDRPRHG